MYLCTIPAFSFIILLKGMKMICHLNLGAMDIDDGTLNCVIPIYNFFAELIHKKSLGYEFTESYMFYMLHSLRAILFCSDMESHLHLFAIPGSKDTNLLCLPVLLL